MYHGMNIEIFLDSIQNKFLIYETLNLQFLKLGENILGMGRRNLVKVNKHSKLNGSIDKNLNIHRQERFSRRLPHMTFHFFVVFF